MSRTRVGKMRWLRRQRTIWERADRSLSNLASPRPSAYPRGWRGGSGTARAPD